MAKHAEKSVLFLCTGNYYRSRFAEILFNSVAAKMGLAWKATSRGLALERGFGNVGPISTMTFQTLQAIGVKPSLDWERYPIQATASDFEASHFVVALKQAEHLPLMQERFPKWAERIEYWHIDDAPAVLGLLEREVMALTARLIGGGERLESAAPAPTKPASKQVTIPIPVVKVGRETKGRRGKGVTIVSDAPLDSTGLVELAGLLKQKCGTGGTVKGGRIEIQGDQRDRITAVLEAMGYRVKGVGG